MLRLSVHVNDYGTECTPVSTTHVKVVGGLQQVDHAGPAFRLLDVRLFLPPGLLSVHLHDTRPISVHLHDPHPITVHLNYYRPLNVHLNDSRVAT